MQCYETKIEIQSGDMIVIESGKISGLDFDIEV